MRAFSDDGKLLDAFFELEYRAPLWSLTLASRGGASSNPKVRNPDYNALYELLLQRSAELDATILSATVESTATSGLSITSRSFLQTPLQLSAASDFVALRRELAAAAAAVGREAILSGGGNRTRRVLLNLAIAGHDDETRFNLECMLVRRPAGLESSPEAVGQLLRRLIGVALRTPTAGSVNTILRVNAASVDVATDRSPNGRAVAFADISRAIDELATNGSVEVATGALGFRSAFLGALLLQLPETHLVDSTPPRVSIEEAFPRHDGSLYRSENRGMRDIDATFDGPLDRHALSRARREQRQLRTALLQGRSVAECAICGERYPAGLLRAAHIKRRSVASDREARDLAHIGMLACSLGCDVLFEEGYITVSSGRVIASPSIQHGSALARRAQEIAGRPVKGFAASAAYFLWHEQTVFMALRGDRLSRANPART